MKASCHCGAIRFEVAEPPKYVAECNCSICSKLGTLWAYYHPDTVVLLSEEAQTSMYVWNERTIAFHTCRTCGCTTHWAAIDTGNPGKMGINARLMEGLSPDSVQLEHLDGGGHGQFWTRQIKPSALS